MSRTPSAFKQTDITRALKAIRNAGYGAARVLIGKDGQIDITTAAPEGEAQTEQGGRRKVTRATTELSR